MDIILIIFNKIVLCVALFYIIFYITTKILLLRAIRRLRRFVEYFCFKDFGDLTRSEINYINNSINYYEILSSHKHYDSMFFTYKAYDYVLIEIKKKLIKYLPEEQIKIRNKMIADILR